MDKTGYIEISISGKKGNLDLAPANYDLRELNDVLEQIENLLIPGEKKERPLISYQLEDFSKKDVNREPADVNALQQSDRVVYVDSISESRNQPVSIEVKNKVLDNNSDIVGNATQTL